MKSKVTLFGQTKHGEDVFRYTIENNSGTSISVISYGATWQDWCYQEDSEVHHVVMNFDTVKDYEENPFHLGNTIGRVAGRIKNAVFDLEGQTFTLEPNEGHHLLHGGTKGWDAKVWNGQINEDGQIVMSTHIVDDGFPGEMDVRIIYTLTEDDEVYIAYEGQSTQTTLFNPMTHVYFNLNDGHSVMDAKLYIQSDEHLVVDNEKIPTGEMIENTGAYDLKEGQVLKEGLAKHPASQYDDCFIVKPNTWSVALEQNDIRLEAKTDRCGAVVFTANPWCIYHDEVWERTHPYNAVAIELQGLPDAVHHSNFELSVLPKGKCHRYENVYRLMMKTKRKNL